MRKLPKYKQNLRIDGNNVYSYNIIVARIKENEIYQLPYCFKYGDVKKQWSSTTQKHINYVADQLCLTLIKNYE